MTYDVTETYTYTGDQLFDSAGEFQAWYGQNQLPFKAAAKTASGADFNDSEWDSLFNLKLSHPSTVSWNVDDQVLTKTIQWPDEAAFLVWDNHMSSFDYTNAAFANVTIGGTPGVSTPGLDLTRTISLP
tara:strand:+ start:1464 stop:1850 length:387 start_codon:yes stop_codon:yes gene_type:complete